MNFKIQTIIKLPTKCKNLIYWEIIPLYHLCTPLTTINWLHKTMIVLLPNNYSQILNLMLSRMDTLNSLKSYLFSMSIKKYTMSLNKRTSATIYDYALFCRVKHSNSHHQDGSNKCSTWNPCNYYSHLSNAPNIPSTLYSYDKYHPK